MSWKPSNVWTVPARCCTRYLHAQRLSRRFSKPTGVLGVPGPDAPLWTNRLTCPRQRPRPWQIAHREPTGGWCSRTLVRWDDRPFVSPLIDVVDRGRPTGLVLVSAEAIRLLHWQAGLVEQPEQSLYELEPGQWRDYDAYVGHPGRTPAGMHVARFDPRIDEWRQRFLTQAAIAIGERVTEFGWHRMLLAGDKQIVNDFADRLTETVRERVVGVVNANVLWEEPGAVADPLEGPLDEAWRRDADKLIDRAIEAASQGGKGALGWPEVLDSIVQHRVEHLVFAADATPDPDALPPYVSDALGKPSAGMVVERAVEHAVASGAEVTAVPDDAGPLLSAGSVVATLRY